jgi:hypothetical protein
MTRLAILISLIASIAMMATAPHHHTPTGVRFEAVEVWVDVGEQPLAAWQIEIIAVRGAVEIVGVESGGAAGYEEPPHYDAAALMGGRIIVAAYSTAPSLPSGVVRVAILHLQVEGNEEPEFASTAMALATTGGIEIPGTVKIQRGEMK